MDLEKDTLSGLPEEPGVYIFKNKQNEALYVGKAKNLKKRVKSYFSKSKDSRISINFLMQEVQSVDFISTNNEEDALILENKTIKAKQPKYNILLKDDKTYASLRVELKKSYPRISIVRKCDDKDSIYLGPFKSSNSLYNTKRLFQKMFGIRDCTDNKYNRHRHRACIYKDIDLCIGPCDDSSLKESYVKNISSIKEIFKGKVGGLSKQVAKNMDLMAEEERFEEAAFYRDQFELLNKNYLFDIRSVDKLKNLDVIGFYVSKKKVQIVILFFRGGYIIDKADFYFGSKTKHQDIEIYQIISQFYSKKLSIPKKILLPNNFQYINELKEDLSAASLSKISIKVARRGKNIRLAELALQNAKNYIKSNIKSEKEIDFNLENMKKILGLDNTPRRIECFDISNTQGSNPVGSMVTFINGRPNKSLYKRFKVQTQGPNDYAMMEEVVSRRLKRVGQTGWEKPDLILIDGGKGHLNKIYRILNRDIGIASIAKSSKSAKIDRIYLPHKKASIDFSGNLEELKILINARNEAHRFAITFHKLKRKEAMFL